MDSLIGRFAISTAGHDAGRMYVIIAWEDGTKTYTGAMDDESGERAECSRDRVFLCDGKFHTWNKWKKKSVKHIKICGESVPKEMLERIMKKEKVFDHEIKYVIKLQEKRKEEGYVKE